MGLAGAAAVVAGAASAADTSGGLAVGAAAVVDGLVVASVSTTVSLSYAGSTTTARIAAAPSEKALSFASRHGTSLAVTARAASHPVPASVINSHARGLLNALVAASGSSMRKIVSPAVNTTSGANSYQRGFQFLIPTSVSGYVRRYTRCCTEKCKNRTMASDEAIDEYLEFLAHVGTGARLTEEQWLFHFDHQNRDAQSGADLGETVPDFALPDQSGVTRTRGELMGERGLLLVFARSADW